MLVGLETMSTNCRIHTVVPPGDGPRNVLRISCASSWFFFARLYRDVRSTKHKKCIPSVLWGFKGENIPGVFENGVVMTYVLTLSIQNY